METIVLFMYELLEFSLIVYTFIRKMVRTKNTTKTKKKRRMDRVESSSWGKPEYEDELEMTQEEEDLDHLPNEIVTKNGREIHFLGERNSQVLVIQRKTIR